jgi:site-specific DNA recombinase
MIHPEAAKKSALFMRTPCGPLSPESTLFLFLSQFSRYPFTQALQQPQPALHLSRNRRLPGVRALAARIEAGSGRTQGGLRPPNSALTRTKLRLLCTLRGGVSHSVSTSCWATQSFNTTTSMGRLTLNILLSFAQFEREVIGERIRDKFAASRKRGMWMGGYVPLGYDLRDRKLIINEAEAATVQMIFKRFVAIGSATKLAKALVAEGLRTKSGRPIDKGYIYRLLNSRVYLGEATHKNASYPGEHVAIIDRSLWDKVHTILQTSPRLRAANARARTPALLKGLIFTETGCAMTPAFTKKGTRLYRYYVSMDVIRSRPLGESPGPLRLPAPMVEDAVIGEIHRMIRAPEITARTIAALRRDGAAVEEAAVVATLAGFERLWGALYPAEQARIVQLLVERITVGTNGIAVDLRKEGLGLLLRDMLLPAKEEAFA